MKAAKFFGILLSGLLLLYPLSFGPLLRFYFRAYKAPGGNIAIARGKNGDLIYLYKPVYRLASWSRVTSSAWLWYVDQWVYDKYPGDELFMGR